MKKKNFFSLLTLSIAVAFVACNNDGNSSASADSTASSTENTTATTEATTATSTGSYAAQADSVRINSEAGNYLDARTGKPIKIKVDPSTGARVNAETGEPVWRYVDRRNWWVYGNDSWDPVGEARMDNNNIRYKGDGDKWMTYDERWKMEDEQKMKEWKIKMDKGDGEIKMESNEDDKIKIEKDGDTKIKKSDGTKIKTDEDGTKIKEDR